MVDVTESELIEEIAAAYEREQRLPGDIDVKQMRQRWKCGRCTASRRLKELVDRGMLEEHVMVHNNRIMLVYRKPNGKEVIENGH